MFLFTKENDLGNIEYKLKIDGINQNRFDKYCSQLKYRVLEGNGKAIYIIGIHNNGFLVGLNKIDKTINIFYSICKNVNCEISFICRCKYLDKKFLIIQVESIFPINNIPFALGF